MQQSYANLCLIGLISLTLLVTGTWSSPILRRSTGELEVPETVQPTYCTQSKPKSTSQCQEELKVRRYFFHELKGCKKYRICPEDASEHDNQTEVNFFQDFDDCQVECMQHLTCQEPTVGPNVVLASTNGLQGWGRKLVYECASGYSLSDNMAKRVRTCEMDGTWSGEAPVCLKQCLAPPPTKHAYIAPAKDMHNQGSTVHYTCQVGYRLEGSNQRICSSDGVWSEEEPTCVCQVATSDPTACPSCPEPSPIEHGQVSAPIRSFNAEVEYTCDDGYTMIGPQTRVCQESGEWSLEEPICWKLSIQKVEDGHEEDVTDTQVTVSVQAMGITFKLDSSTPNPFPDLEPEWVFKEGELPSHVTQVGLNLVFDTILRSKEQEGTYTISLGNYSTYFELKTQEATQPPDPPTVVAPPFPLPAQGTASGTVDILCAFEGCPIPKVVWYHNGQQVDFQDSRISSLETKSHGFVASQLFISGLTAEDSGSYHCQATNSEDSIDSFPILLSVNSNRRKRSAAEEEDSTQTSFSCSQDDDVLTFVGQVRRDRRPLRRASETTGMTEYTVQVSQTLRGSEKLSSKRLRVVMVDLQSSPDSRLSENVDYVFQGRVRNQTLYVTRQTVQRHSQELEKSINSC